LELAKLQNYLQVTRAEMVFASGVILVEGIAERNLITAWYPELDEKGISVCSIDGVDFDIYESFLNDFEIPYVIITDWDPKQTITNKKDEEIPGDQAATKNSYLSSESRNIVTPPVFYELNGCTLEWSLLQVEFYKNIIKDMAEKNQPIAGERNFKKAADASTLTFKKCWDSLDLNKGMVSSRLASEIKLKKEEIKQSEKQTTNNKMLIPPYINRAVEYLKSQCSGESALKMGNTVGNLGMVGDSIPHKEADVL